MLMHDNGVALKKRIQGTCRRTEILMWRWLSDRMACAHRVWFSLPLNIWLISIPTLYQYHAFNFLFLSPQIVVCRLCDASQPFQEAPVVGWSGIPGSSTGSRGSFRSTGNRTRGLFLIAHGVQRDRISILQLPLISYACLKRDKKKEIYHCCLRF